ncbi:MAG: class I SAM-dependent methyltransferase [Cyanobium sp.]
MIDPIAPQAAPSRICPPWLIERLDRHGGQVPFRTYMEWVLHDPVHGAYASGQLRIGPQGDFTTAPSLGDDFAALLAPQVASWLQELGPGNLALIETGPGEGTLARDLARQLAEGWPDLARRTALVLVDPSDGLVERQRQLLADCPLEVRWCSVAELSAEPRAGVVLAHEVLDALSVDRIVWDGVRWRRQLVALESVGRSEGPSLTLIAGDALSAMELRRLGDLGLVEPGAQRQAGWTSELHPGLTDWLAACAVALDRGVLLVIDYAMEAARYYAPQRSQGTLMAYRGQRACADPLLEPGFWDLTAHLCLETLENAATDCGWRPLGQRRQGEALLALGLAQRLHGLQQSSGSTLAELFSRREALLRLVDPATLGDFRWIAFCRGAFSPGSRPLFLQDPPLA